MGDWEEGFARRLKLLATHIYVCTHYDYFTTLLSCSVIVQTHIGRLMNCCLDQLTPFYVSHFDYIFLRNRLNFGKIARTLVESIQSL